MVKRMLIDASHPEETRVAVLSGKRIEEFDYETTAKRPLKGNIYLAKITRVEPSLQAAFVDYGGNRHGFLPFTEIHPDYYRIPIADREALIAEEVALKGDSPDDADSEDNGNKKASPADGSGEDVTDAGSEAEAAPAEEVEEVETESEVDTIGGDEMEEDRRKRAKLLRRYKIQEVIKRRQVILVQVSKEERGNKGAALTTYLSLPGRYCVLMPNTGRGGGISRKIGNPTDRRRLKKIVADLKIPDGVAVIVRTAGSQRSKAEIKRDYEYLLRLWDDIRQTTLQSTAPSLIYEEGNLIKRTIRDLYSRDMDEILLDGEEGYKSAKSFMKTLMPSHARNVKLYRDPAIPLFKRYQVEGQIDAIHNPTVELASGGYIVISPTEALVSIDINSGRATKERHIETTALKTNLEAAEEIARQLRLRDLAGLIVIDFIDMEDHRHNREVERRLKDAMRHDRARIQLGRISHFGLLEMSRQRLRPSLIEASTEVCLRCGGTGHVRTSESSALHILRVIEDQGIRRSDAQLSLTMHPDVALFLLNQMRDRLIEIEQRYRLKVSVSTDDALVPPNYRMEVLGPTGEVIEVQDESEAEETTGRRRRRRGRRTKESPAEESTAEAPAAEAPAAEAATAEEDADRSEEAGEDLGDKTRRRRRGKRGGRRRSRRRREIEAESGVGEESGSIVEDEAVEAEAEDELMPAGRTPPPDEASDEVLATAGEEPAEEKPARGRRRSAQKADDGEEDAGASAKAGRRPRRKSAKTSAAASDEAETEDGEPRAAARERSRRRRPAAAPEAEAPQEPTAPPQPEPVAAVPQTPAAAPTANGDDSGRLAEDRGPASEPVAAEATAPEPALAVPPETMPAETMPADDQATQSDKPKRRGWWNRLGG